MLCNHTTAYNEDEDDTKEPLFEKPLTPSDVGKLNRLVIPKLHAEKHFPFNAVTEKRLLLGFEDEVGKSWRFRYSYWNSSQSYVLTKGWRRFVKEKRLQVGDFVVFARHPKEVGRFFIGWRRRRHGGGVLYPGYPYPTQQQERYQTVCPQPHAEEHRRGRNGSWKRLRLFGVNLEWDEDRC